MRIKKLNFLISAGPTRERIDPIRFISNFSSGKMGYALARGAVKAGHKATLVSGPVSLKPPHNVDVIQVESAADMFGAIKEKFAEFDIIIMTAAVADYRPVKISQGKIKKSAGNLKIELERTVDILKYLGENKKAGQILVGFAAETENLLKNAKNKLKTKNLDWIIANEAGKADRAFGADKNEVIMLSKSGKNIKIPLASKLTISRKIIEIILRKKG